MGMTGDSFALCCLEGAASGRGNMCITATSRTFQTPAHTHCVDSRAGITGEAKPACGARQEREEV